MNFDHAEDHALSYVRVLIRHLVSQDVGEAHEVFDEGLDVACGEVLSLEFLNISEFVLDHAQKCLQARWLFCSKERLDSL